MSQVFAAVSCTQERSRLPAHHKHLWPEQTTYPAGEKTLMPLPKLESQAPSGPPGGVAREIEDREGERLGWGWRREGKKGGEGGGTGGGEDRRGQLAGS